MLEQYVAAAGTILSGAILVPQIARLIRRRQTAGVAVTWAAFGLVTNVSWVIYLGVLDLWVAAIAPGFAVVTYAIVLRLVAPTGRHAWLVIAVGYGVVLAAIGIIGGIADFGITLAVVPAVQLSPQLVAVYREACPAGVSPITWIISICEAGIWSVYGLMIGDTALIGYGVVTSAGSALVLGCWWTSFGASASPVALGLGQGSMMLNIDMNVSRLPKIASTAATSPTT